MIGREVTRLPVVNAYRAGRAWAESSLGVLTQALSHQLCSVTSFLLFDIKHLRE
jgi:hypothetical protein